MKAEINNENKEKFFAQYWGQNVLSINGGEVREVTTDMNHVLCYDKMYESHLSIKSLSNITEEDKEYRHKLILEIYFDVSPQNRILLEHHYSDYLRSKGYALPWMGLSVEEMIEAGWIKLKEENEKA